MKALIEKKTKSSESHEYTAEFFKKKTFLKDIKHSIVRAINCPF